MNADNSSRLPRRGAPFETVVVSARPAISVIGLDRYGVMSCASLAILGFNVTGVDLSHEAVRAVKAGRSPELSGRPAEWLSEGVRRGHIDATQNLIAAVLATDITFLSCRPETSVEGHLASLRQPARAIGQALSMKDTFHVVVLRSLSPLSAPLDYVAAEIEKASGKVLGRDFGVAFNPEYFRDGGIEPNLFSLPKAGFAASDAVTAELVTALYHSIDARVSRSMAA